MPQKKGKKTGAPNINLTVAIPGRKPQQKSRKRYAAKLGAPKQNRSDIAVAVRQYAIALRDPFDQSADGVRLPDLYRFATTTQKYCVRTQLTSDAAGVLAFTVLPTPFYCLQMFNGSQLGISTYPNNGSASYLANPGALCASGFGQYRVVSWGFRVLLADSTVSAKGIYTVAPAPVPQNAELDFDSMQGIPNQAGRYFTDLWALPQPNPALESLPHRRTFNAQDLQYKGDLMGVGVPYSAIIQEFRPLSTDGQTPYWNGYLSTNKRGSCLVTSAGLPSTVASIGNVGTMNAAGHIAYMVYASGLPVSTAEVSLELVYHLELVATPSAGVTGVFPSAAAPVGSTATLEKAFQGVKDSLYLGDKTIGRAAEFLGRAGMAGYRYAQQRPRDRYQALR